jgi:tRNA uridine 5-carboxymethylaminomethyl modification enzyme
MFTSRAEYRLSLREDNADLRLRKIGHELGLVSESEYRRFLKKRDAIHRLRALMESRRVHGVLLNVILKRPEVTGADLVRSHIQDFRESPEFQDLDPALQEEVVEQVEIQVKYEGYLERQGDEIRRFQKMETVPIPSRFSYQGIPGLSREIVEKLTKIRPASLGQAGRIPGMTPAAISILMVYLHRSSHESHAG